MHISWPLSAISDLSIVDFIMWLVQVVFVILRILIAEYVD